MAPSPKTPAPQTQSGARVAFASSRPAGSPLQGSWVMAYSAVALSLVRTSRRSAIRADLPVRPRR